MCLDLVSRLPGTNTYKGRLSNLMQEYQAYTIVFLKDRT